MNKATVCGLTHAYPQSDGCCHHNVEIIHAEQPVTRQMLNFPDLEEGDETVLEALQNRDVPFDVNDQGQIVVSPGELGLPLTYGIGTEDPKEEDMDWSAWMAEWQG